MYAKIVNHTYHKGLYEFKKSILDSNWDLIYFFDFNNISFETAAYVAIIEVEEQDKITIFSGIYKAHKFKIVDILSLNNIKTFKYLVEKEVGVQSLLSNPRFWLDEKLYLECIQYLVENKIGFNDILVQQTAIMNHQSTVIEYLNSKNLLNSCLLSFVCSHGNLEMVKIYLSKNNKDIDLKFLLSNSPKHIRDFLKKEYSFFGKLKKFFIGSK